MHHVSMISSLNNYRPGNEAAFRSRLSKSLRAKASPHALCPNYLGPQNPELILVGLQANEWMILGDYSGR
jgi:hypothetical protein